MSDKQHDYDIEEARKLLQRVDKGIERRPGVFDWLLTQKRVSWLAVLGILISGLAITFIFYHFLTGFFPAPQAHLHRSIHINILLVLCFLLWPLGRKSWKDRFHFLTVIDIACILLVIAIQVWISHDIDSFVMKQGNLTVLDQVMCMLYLALVLEGTRRTMGTALPLVVLFFIAHTLFTDRFPGLLFGPSTTVEWLADMQVIQTYGLFGIPVMSMSSYVALFITFAVLLTNSGAGKTFTKLALGLTGWQIGGPAKASVVSSAILGTMTGSTIGNVVGTGSFTIPLMIQTGYRRHFAAAVEACSSCGGMIMPPVMGVTAFVMAEFMGVPYIQVVYAAAIPAFLYFLSVFIQVHFEGLKTGLRPLPRELLPKIGPTLKEGWILLVPLLVVVGFFVRGYTIPMAAFWGVVAVYLSTMLKKETRLAPLRLFSTLEAAAKTIVPVGLACASAGIILGCVFSSGLGMRFSTMIVALAGNKLWLALVFTMIAAIVLGMGMIVTPVYITLAAMVVPSMISSMNVYPMAAHMFALYFAVKSSITPPVALSAYAAAGIAGSKPMRTGNTAFRIGFAGFIVPFMFVYKPELLLHGTPANIVWTLVTCIVAIGLLAVTIEGWMFTRISVLERVFLVMGAIFFIMPSVKTTLIGFALMAVVIVIQKVKIFWRRRDSRRLASM